LLTTLRDVHFIFDATMDSSSYYEVVNRFTDYELLFYRMVFDIKSGKFVNSSFDNYLHLFNLRERFVLPQIDKTVH